MYKLYIKRALDVVFSCIALIVLSPLFLLIAITIKLSSRGPVFFKQERFGRNKRPFLCYKFRTMKSHTPPSIPTRLLHDGHLYITACGRLLRRFGIDELPQLINIARGEMSFIGPRPVILAETDLICERDKYGANACMPGIGGWAQSNGRDEISVKDKARLDGEYAQDFGLRMDMSCLWRTVVAIFTSSGFKEGHIGDTSYKHRVEKNTKKINPVRRLTTGIGRTVVKIRSRFAA